MTKPSAVWADESHNSPHEIVHGMQGVAYLPVEESWIENHAGGSPNMLVLLCDQHDAQAVAGLRMLGNGTVDTQCVNVSETFLQAISERLHMLLRNIDTMLAYYDEQHAEDMP